MTKRELTDYYRHTSLSSKRKEDIKMMLKKKFSEYDKTEINSSDSQEITASDNEMTTPARVKRSFFKPLLSAVAVLAVVTAVGAAFIYQAKQQEDIKAGTSVSQPDSDDNSKSEKLSETELDDTAEEIYNSTLVFIDKCNAEGRPYNNKEVFYKPNSSWTDLYCVTYAEPKDLIQYLLYNWQGEVDLAKCTFKIEFENGSPSTITLYNNGEEHNYAYAQTNITVEENQFTEEEYNTIAQEIYNSTLEYIDKCNAEGRPYNNQEAIYEPNMSWTETYCKTNAEPKDLIQYILNTWKVHSDLRGDFELSEYSFKIEFENEKPSKVTLSVEGTDYVFTNEN